MERFAIERGAGSLLQVLKEAGVAWINDNALRLSAALAYYAFLSLTPLMILILLIAGMAYGEQGAIDRVAEQIRSLAGEQAGSAIIGLVRTAHQARSDTAVLGSLVLLLSASGVFGELKSAMNSIWGLVTKPGRSYCAIALEHLVLFGMVVLSGIFVIAAVAFGAILSGIESFIGPILPLPASMLHVADGLVTLVVTSVLFLLIFLLLPDVRLRLKDVWASAVGTAFLFTIGKLLIGIYLGTSGVASSYGAAGSVIVVQLWIYYSAAILFFGVELVKVVTKRRRATITPRRNAEWIEGRNPSCSPGCR